MTLLNTKNRPNGLTVFCKQCFRKRSKESWNKIPPEQRRSLWRQRHWIKQYGVKKGLAFAVAYDRLLIEQCAVCAICKLPERRKNMKGEIKALAVDHCHTTDRIRGLLCHDCNTGIGLLKESLANLDAAKEYLRRE